MFPCQIHTEQQRSLPLTNKVIRLFSTNMVIVNILGCVCLDFWIQMSHISDPVALCSMFPHYHEHKHSNLVPLSPIQQLLL